MVIDYEIHPAEEIKKMASDHVDSLQEYISSLKEVIRNNEKDIENVKKMANIFLNSGQIENYGYLMERNYETEMRIETCKECIEECEQFLEKHQ